MVVLMVGMTVEHSAESSGKRRVALKVEMKVLPRAAMKAWQTAGLSEEEKVQLLAASKVVRWAEQ